MKHTFSHSRSPSFPEFMSEVSLLFCLGPVSRNSEVELQGTVSGQPNRNRGMKTHRWEGYLKKTLYIGETQKQTGNEESQVSHETQSSFQTRRSVRGRVLIVLGSHRESQGVVRCLWLKGQS